MDGGPEREYTASIGRALRNTEERRYTRMATHKKNKLPVSRHCTKAELMCTLENVYRRLQKQGFTEDQLEYLF